MQVPETDVTWTYSLLNVSESKASARTGTPAGSAAELVGVDGSNNGGLVPFHGFKFVYRFTPDTATGWSSTNPYVAGTNAHRCKVVDFWSFNVLAGTGYRVYGYVYLVRRPDTVSSCVDTYDLLVAYNAPQSATATWSTYVVREGITSTTSSVLSDAGAAIMSIETTSKSVYVFAKGTTPKVIYFKVNGTSTDISVLDAGPGTLVKSSAETAQFQASTKHAAASLVDTVTHTNYPQGAVVFSRTSLTNYTSNNVSTISNIATAPKIAAGNYSLAVQFEDSRSGRKSQITKSEEMAFTGSNHALFVDGYLENTKFDTVNIYRSVRTENAAGAYSNAILQLEASITVSSYSVTAVQMQNVTDNNGGVDPLSTDAKWTYFRYAYQLTDNALVMQDVFLDKPAYSTTMPKGGAGALLDGTMLVGSISDSAADSSGTGETRWSASGSDSPEMFTASGIYRPSAVGDAVIAFRRTGQVMAGFTKTGIQLFNKENGYVRALAAHQGYGITGPYAAATVGPVTYYLNSRGLKAIYPDGRLDDVRSINQLVSDEWYSDSTGATELNKVSMSFDPATLCLFILNPVKQTAVLMWFSTGVVTELRDMVFAKTVQGWVEESGQLQPRSVFVQNAPLPYAVSNTSFRPAVFTPSRDYRDKYTLEAADQPVYMMDTGGDISGTHVCTNGTFTNNVSYTYWTPGCVSVTRTNGISVAASGANPFGMNTDARASYLIGQMVYVANTTDPAKNGSRAVIINATSTGITVASANPLLNSATTPVCEGEIVLSPVYFRWTGSPLQLADSKDEEFVTKQPTSIGAVFADVEGSPNEESNYRYWRGSVYRENETSPLVSGLPAKADGTLIAQSIQRGDTPNWVAFGKHGALAQWWFPSVETWFPNVKYRLVGAQVKGRMLPTDRSRRTL